MSSKVTLQGYRPRQTKRMILNPTQERTFTPYIQNSVGLADLPVELLDLIISFLPGIPVPCVREEGLENLDTFHRSQALEALAQTCRTVRAVVLPLVWGTIDVVQPLVQDLRSPMPGVDRRHNSEHMALSTQLVRQLQTVTIREPGYATSVRTISVVLCPSAKIVYWKLLCAMACLPNLTTVQILGLEDEARRVFLAVLRAWLSKHSPINTVRTFVIPVMAASSIRLFGNLERFICLPSPELGPLRSTIEAVTRVGLQACMVEELGMTWMRHGRPLHVDLMMEIIGHIGRQLHNLRSLPFNFQVVEDKHSVRFKAAWQHLDQLHFLRTFDFEGHDLTMETVKHSPSVRMAMKVLQGKKEMHSATEPGEAIQFAVRVWDGVRLFTTIIVGDTR